MRIGLLGGTFNPPHHGHVICAQESRIALALDAVWLVPAARPPHRAIEGDPGADARLELCRRAVAGQPGLDVSAVELDRGGTSYSVDTLEELAGQKPDDTRTLIIGADQAAAFGGWRRPERIGELAEIAVVARAGHASAQAAEAVAGAAGGAAPRVVEMPRVDVSSSLIRERLAQRQTVAHLVPAGVAELIAERGLYR